MNKVQDISNLVNSIDSFGKQQAMKILQFFDVESAERGEVKHYQIYNSHGDVKTEEGFKELLQSMSEAGWLSFAFYAKKAISEKYVESSDLLDSMFSIVKIGKVKVETPVCFDQSEKKTSSLEQHAYTYKTENGTDVVRLEMNYSIELY